MVVESSDLALEGSVPLPEIFKFALHLGHAALQRRLLHLPLADQGLNPRLGLFKLHCQVLFGGELCGQTLHLCTEGLHGLTGCEPLLERQSLG